MWQKAYEESKRTESMSTAVSQYFLDTCQDILKAMELPNDTYAVALQLFIKEPSY